jgi:hypothetical protein
VRRECVTDATAESAGAAGHDDHGVFELHAA